MSTNSIWVSISCADLAMRGDRVEPLVGHGDAADVGLDRAERIVRRLRRCRFGQSVEKRRFADVRQADDAAAKAQFEILRFKGTPPLSRGRQVLPALTFR